MDAVAAEYVAARRVLLDALEALTDHLPSLILVGAQAVYHHTGDADLNVPLMTTDADLAIDTRGLTDVPEIGAVLRAAGFVPGPNPGHWVAASDIAVDLMVVPHQARTAKASARAARLAPHDRQTARIARGLEPALVDHERVVIGALDPVDTRTFDLAIAGPAALLVAKVIKISERLGQTDRQPDRLKEKDALDAFRLLQAVETSELVLGLTKHRGEPNAATVADEALEILRLHASTPRGRIALLASSAAGGDITVAPAFAALCNDLLAALQTRPTQSEPPAARP
ncbi:MAG: hypothetical protein IPL43_08120 [Micropruina sp.]|nr:hypothetical protein [Micropruina sp.]